MTKPVSIRVINKSNIVGIDLVIIKCQHLRQRPVSESRPVHQHLREHRKRHRRHLPRADGARYRHLLKVPARDHEAALRLPMAWEPRPAPRCSRSIPDLPFNARSAGTNREVWKTKSFVFANSCILIHSVQSLWSFVTLVVSLHGLHTKMSGL